MVYMSLIILEMGDQSDEVFYGRFWVQDPLTPVVVIPMHQSKGKETPLERSHKKGDTQKKVRCPC
jgi:hypothetical protein